MEFKNLSFSKDKDNLIVTFKSNYYFTIPLEEIEEIGKFSIKENTIEFDCVKKVAEKKFDNLIDKHFNLINKVTKNPTTYVDEEFPLIGTLSFGIVDKGTNILELKPISGCNSDCIFCSVDSGKTSKKAQDFYVDKDHLVNETKKLVEYKDTPTDIYINPQGESLLYPDLEELIQDLRKIKLINQIIIITNGLTLNKKKIDTLIKAGTSQFNVSISTFNNSEKIIGVKADSKAIKENLKHIASKNKLLICPVWMHRINDEDIEEIVKFGKSINAKFGIQNFLKYPKGRSPTKEVNFEKFYEKLKSLENKYKIQLTPESLKLEQTKEYPIQFKKNQIVKAKIISKGPYKNERIATAKDRCITVMGCTKKVNQEVKVKILRIRHNIYSASVK